MVTNYLKKAIDDYVSHHARLPEFINISPYEHEKLLYELNRDFGEQIREIYGVKVNIRFDQSYRFR